MSTCTSDLNSCLEHTATCIGEVNGTEEFFGMKQLCSLETMKAKVDLLTVIES